MIPALYISERGETEIRDGGLIFALPKGFTSSTPFNRNLKLVEVGKSMDSFDYLNSNLVSKLKDKIDSLYDFKSPLKFIINFAIEESRITNDIVKFYKELFHNRQIIFLTNNISYLGQENFIFYNNNAWVVEDCDIDFIDSLYRIKKYDLGTLKKKFMFLNNHFSPIRFDILKLIFKNENQSDGNISFNLINFNDIHAGINSENEFIKECEEHGVSYPMYYDTYPGLTQITDYERDRKSILSINHIGTVSINYRIYLESFFEIITETHHLLNSQGLYLSEKIHKPLKAGNPFVYYGKKEVKEILEKRGFTFNSPIYFFGEGEEFMNHLESLLEKDMNWYNDTQRTHLNEYIHNIKTYSRLQTEQSDIIIKYIYT